VADMDNALPVDLDSVLSVESFVHLVKERAEAMLVEPFAAPDELVSQGPDGKYTHEVVVPFVRSADPAASAAGHASIVPAGFPRAFPPGSPWLAVKLYTSTTVADELLRELVRPLVDRARAGSVADSWFFIRYVDPGFHLRLRFHGEPEALIRRLLPDVLAAVEPFFADGRISNVQLATYEREVGRYGGPDCIPLAERLFEADSDAVLALVEQLAAGDADARWRLALRGMDQLLGDLGLTLDERLELMTRSREEFKQRFHGGVDLDRQLGQRFRSQRRAHEALFEPAAGAEGPLAAGLAALGRRSERLHPIVGEMRALERAGQLTRPLRDQAWSYVHMFGNRLFRDAALAQELVLYDALARLYESQRARARKA